MLNRIINIFHRHTADSATAGRTAATTTADSATAGRIAATTTADSATAGGIAATTAAQPTLPDDLLEDIFLRLGNPADLARASASCASFRRIVSGRRFLRRYGSLHRPPVVGFLDCARGQLDCARRELNCAHRCLGPGINGLYQAEPPHRSAPAGRALARAADFTFPFLSDSRGCRVHDLRDGRVLLSRYTAGRITLEDLIVYDPLHRRHIQIPPIPEILLGVFEHLEPFLDPATEKEKQTEEDLPFRVILLGVFEHLEPFLDPATEKEKQTEEDLPFRVICNVFTKENIRTFIFSSGTGKWRRVTSFEADVFRWPWSHLRLLKWPWSHPRLLKRHYACSCFYWTECHTPAMLVLETREMKFSITYDLPPESKGRAIIVGEAAEGRLGLFMVCKRNRMLDVYSKKWRQHNGVASKDYYWRDYFWRHDNRIPLLDSHDWTICAGGEGYALLRGFPRDVKIWEISFENNPDTPYFTVELKTLLVERLCVTQFFGTSPDYLYASFPPPLSPPSL